MFLLFDVSTNGKPKNWRAHFTDTFSWPKLLHIAWLLYDKKGNLTEEGDYLINPMSMELDPAALRMAGLTEDQLKNEGKDVREVLEKFGKAVEQSMYIFAFNLQYNENVVLAELYRNNMEHKFMQAERFCLMRESTYFCRIPGKDGGFKWPSLTELHAKLFKVGYEGAGNASKDIMAISRCFNKLLNLGQLDDLF
jgi:hypothetical protein